jgi:16S rRNA G1207 methylase RsmC
MNIDNIVTNVTTAIALGVIGIIIELIAPVAMATYKQLISALPANVRKVVLGHADTMVKSIAQQFADWTPEQKKAYAVEQVSKALPAGLLKKAGIDSPDEFISHAIEQVIWEIKNLPAEQTAG